METQIPGLDLSGAEVGKIYAPCGGVYLGHLMVQNTNLTDPIERPFFGIPEPWHVFVAGAWSDQLLLEREQQFPDMAWISSSLYERVNALVRPYWQRVCPTTGSSDQLCLVGLKSRATIAASNRRSA